MCVSIYVCLWVCVYVCLLVAICSTDSVGMCNVIMTRAIQPNTFTPNACYRLPAFVY